MNIITTIKGVGRDELADVCFALGRVTVERGHEYTVTATTTDLHEHTMRAEALERFAVER